MSVHATKELESKNLFGFWIYLMTDCLLFASLFAAFAVLQNNTFGGPAGREIFSMPFVLLETLLLLTSSFTCGLAVVALKNKDKTKMLGWLAVTYLLGLGFLMMELTEFIKLYNEGNSWQRSGFLSAFFTLVATHGIHITIGLVWIIVLSVQIMKKGITNHVVRRSLMFSMFWHFLDVIWIFIFTFVYLLGGR